MQPPLSTPPAASPTSPAAPVLPHLLEVLESWMTREYCHTGHPWVEVKTLSHSFLNHYGIPLETWIKTQGYGDSLQAFFTAHGHFSLYTTAIPHHFYIAPFRILFPHYTPTSPLSPHPKSSPSPSQTRRRYC